MRATIVTTCLAVSVLSVLSAQQTPPRDTVRRAAPTGTAAIVGSVLIDETEPKALRRARVTATSAELPGGRTVITQDDGSYRIEGLPPGRYSVRAVKDGYVAMAFGARRPTAAGTAIALSSGETRRATNIRLPRGAVLSGTVIDIDGQPVPGVTVVALARRFLAAAGERRLVPTGVASVTDDRGEYRLFGLAAGDYAISASSRATPGAELQVISEAEIRRALSEIRSRSPFRSRPGVPLPPAPAPRQPAEPRRTVTYAPVYFPGTTRGSQAMLVTLGRGEERAGLDVSVEYVPTARISGTVIMPDAGGQSIQVRLVQTEQTVATENIRSMRTGTGGGFAFSGVAPGQYTLIAQAYAGGTSASSPGMQWATMDVVVDGEALDGLFLTAQSGLTIEGRLAFEGATPPPSFAARRLGLPAAHASSGVQASPVLAIDPDGRFTVTLFPGAYRLATSMPGLGAPLGRWFLESIVVDGTDILDAPLDFRHGTTDAVVTFADRATELSGRVISPDGDTGTDCYVVVFSVTRSTWFPGSRRVVGIRPRDDGTFTIRNLPAGTYFAVAASDVDMGEWYDAALLERLSVGAVKITLGDAEKKLQDLRVR